MSPPPLPLLRLLADEPRANKGGEIPSCSLLVHYLLAFILHHPCPSSERRGSLYLLLPCSLLAPSLLAVCSSAGLPLLTEEGLGVVQLSAELPLLTEEGLGVVQQSQESQGWCNLLEKYQRWARVYSKKKHSVIIFEWAELTALV